MQKYENNSNLIQVSKIYFAISGQQSVETRQQYFE